MQHLPWIRLGSIAWLRYQRILWEVNYVCHFPSKLQQILIVEDNMILIYRLGAPLASLFLVKIFSIFVGLFLWLSWKCKVKEIQSFVQTLIFSLYSFLWYSSTGNQIYSVTLGGYFLWQPSRSCAMLYFSPYTMDRIIPYNNKALWKYWENIPKYQTDHDKFSSVPPLKL